MKINLTTTDYAILGLLERRPWSAYELTQYLCSSSIRGIWPRAESRIYESPKKLTRLLLCSASVETVGKKSRTVYSISDGGRDAIAQWLKLPGKGATIEHEALLKLIFSDIGQAEQQQQLFASIRQQVEDSNAQIKASFERLSQSNDADTPAPQLAQHLLVNRFIQEMWSAQQKWLTLADDFDQQWRDCENETEQRALIAQQYQQALQSLAP